ncbi:DUF3949 domain-containing protein [Brevibacillus daliensis]|uniref:DUF3949 domain-containing protein n=1 Tax=Brevibacillus daliensis TaxID=2892995 RepID=UPI001E5B074A|nr:DUF3949 domain-containing protein [Brevibacillus daliensis]
MNDDNFWKYVLAGAAIFYFLAMIPAQYTYQKEMIKKRKQTGINPSQLYEKMSFQEEQLHFHMQGNLFNLPSAIVAYLYIRFVERYK